MGFGGAKYGQEQISIWSVFWFVVALSGNNNILGFGGCFNVRDAL